MKVFFISLILLTLIISLTVFLSVAGYKLSDKLLKKASEAYSASVEDLEDVTSELLDLWESSRPTLSFSLHKKEIETINSIIISMSESANAENGELLYRNLCRQLKGSLTRIKELHTLTFEGVF